MKRFNFFKIAFLLVSFLLIEGMTGCKKQLDINTDPNNPSLKNGTPALVFPAAVASSAGRIGGDMAILGGIWAQYWAQSSTANQYKAIDQYNLTKTDNFTEDAYAELYSGALNDYHFVIEKAKATQDWNFYLLGTVMSAYTLEVLDDLFDMLPYSEAFQGSENLQPKFDDGYSIYKSLLASIDTALSKDFTASTNTPPGSSDLIFDGDISKWIQFANTLELKMYLRMAYAKPDDAKNGIIALYNNGANFLTVDASLDKYVDQPNKDNPLYEYNYRALNVTTNLRASVTLLSWLKQNSDPRISYYFKNIDGSTASYVGVNQGDFTATLTEHPEYANAAVANIRPTDPVQFISAAESYFLQAEARERYFNGDGAKELYDDGVTAAFAQYGLDASDFIKAGGVYEYPSAGTFEQKLEAIIVQKWASFPGSHALEGFFEKNRTGYPKTSPVYSTDPSYIPGEFVYSKNGVTDGKFPKRLVFPDIERSRNTNTPAEVPITTNVWWDTK